MRQEWTHLQSSIKKTVTITNTLIAASGESQRQKIDLSLGGQTDSWIIAITCEHTLIKVLIKFGGAEGEGTLSLAVGSHGKTQRRFYGRFYRGKTLSRIFKRGIQKERGQCKGMERQSRMVCTWSSKSIK